MVTEEFKKTVDALGEERKIIDKEYLEVTETKLRYMKAIMKCKADLERMNERERKVLGKLNIKTIKELDLKIRDINKYFIMRNPIDRGLSKCQQNKVNGEKLYEMLCEERGGSIVENYYLHT